MDLYQSFLNNGVPSVRFLCPLRTTDIKLLELAAPVRHTESVGDDRRHFARPKLDTLSHTNHDYALWPAFFISYLCSVCHSAFHTDVTQLHCRPIAGMPSSHAFPAWCVIITQPVACSWPYHRRSHEAVCHLCAVLNEKCVPGPKQLT